MADAGFTGIFTSLHISEDDASMYLRYLKPLLQIVEKRNLKLVADISGDAIKNIGLSYTNPKEISKKGFSGLRMDDGIDMETIANLSHYLRSEERRVGKECRVRWWTHRQNGDG